MKSKLILFAAAIVALSACHPNPGSSSPSESITVVDTTDFYTIEASYPNSPLDTGNIIKNYIDYVVDQKKAEWKADGEAYNDEMALRQQFPDRPQAPYTFNIGYKEFRSERYRTTTFLFSTYEFTGGANGSTTVNTFAFNDNLRPIAYTDLFNLGGNNDIAITRLIAAQALEQDSTLDADMLNAGLGLAFLQDDGVTLDREKCQCDGFLFASNLATFVVTDDSVDFYYEPGTIAPTVDGKYRVSLPITKLKSYLIEPYNK